MTMTDNPLISIIMNCYNGEKYLQEALDSVINQTYKNWELIFFDNLSTDNSQKIFNSYLDHRFFYYKSNTHIPLTQARNKAVNKCKGEFIAFLDIDDWWENFKLEKQINFMEKNNEIISEIKKIGSQVIDYLSLYCRNPYKGFLPDIILYKIAITAITKRI